MRGERATKSSVRRKSERCRENAKCKGPVLGKVKGQQENIGSRERKRVGDEVRSWREL